MLKKEDQLLQALYQNRHKFLTAVEIGEYIGMSERTVRTYIRQLNPLLTSNGAEIIVKHGAGFKLEIYMPQAFDILYKKQQYLDTLPTTTDNSDRLDNRENYLLTRLLLNDTAVLFETLMSELFISRSTLSKEFRKLKQLLSPYKLTVTSRAGKGVYITGMERDKRRFIMDYFFGQNYVQFVQEHIGDTHFFAGIRLDAITLIIIEECRKAHLKVHDFVIQNLVLHLALSINRLKQSISISTTEIVEVSDTTIAYQVAQKIIARVEVLQQINFPSQEVSFLALHLVSKATETKQGEPAEHSLEIALRSCLSRSDKETGYSFSEDPELISALIAHITAMQLRVANGMVLVNPLLDKVKSNFNFEFQLTQDILGQLPQLSASQISDDEWAYLTLHFMVALEKAKDKQTIRVLVVCATGIGSAQLLRTRIEKTFGKKITIVGVYGYFDLSQAMLTEVDVIISSIDLSKLVFTVPTVHVSVFLDKDDVNRISTTFDKVRTQGYHSEIDQLSSLTTTEKRELCQSLFSADSFSITTESQKISVIDTLLNQLKIGENDGYTTRMHEQILSREQLSSVVFSDSIAVPHPIVPQGITAKIGVAISKTGINWQPDFPKIHIVFLLSPSQTENPHLTLATKAIVALLDLPDVQEKLLVAETFDDFIDLFIPLI